jgi:ASC-1-like (ASCH) protein
MATYDANLHEQAFEEMEASRKTVYTLIATPEYSMICAGDRVEFGKFGSITIGMVRKYPSLEKLVEREGWQCLVPNADDADDALAQLRDANDWDSGQEQELGIVAMRVREARRKDND